MLVYNKVGLEIKPNKNNPGKITVKYHSYCLRLISQRTSECAFYKLQYMYCMFLARICFVRKRKEKSFCIYSNTTQY